MLEGIKKCLTLWKKQCSSTKIILVIGFACLINIAMATIMDFNSLPENNIAIKSVLSSIFGYVFGKHCIPTKFGHEEIQTMAGGTVAIICLVVLFITNFSPVNTSITNLSDIRDLLLISVGFLISKAKNQKDSCSK